MSTIHLRLRCPRCRREKTIVISWRTRLLQATGTLPPDTRCQPCWAAGYYNVSMSIVSAKAYPRSGRAAREPHVGSAPGSPVACISLHPASAPTPGEAA